MRSEPAVLRRSLSHLCIVKEERQRNGSVGRYLLSAVAVLGSYLHNYLIHILLLLWMRTNLLRLSQTCCLQYNLRLALPLIWFLVSATHVLDISHRPLCCLVYRRVLFVLFCDNATLLLLVSTCLFFVIHQLASSSSYINLLLIPHTQHTPSLSQTYPFSFTLLSLFLFFQHLTSSYLYINLIVFPNTVFVDIANISSFLSLC